MNDIVTSLVSKEMIARMMEIAISAPNGCFAEVGVYKGGTARELYWITENQGRQLFLYDTFDGMPFKGEHDTHDVGMFSECSADEIKAMMPNANVVKGVFPQSIVPMPPVAFVHADADQYQSTLDICRYFVPLMASGGMILFDDYYCVPSCVKAVDECFPEKTILPDGRALVTF